MIKTLLVVDDEQDLRELISDLLIEEGFICISAGSVGEAELVVAKHLDNAGGIDLIISDLNMPGGSGIDLLKKLRKKGVNAPFLYLSGSSVDAELESYTPMGVVGYHLKPFRAVELVARIKGIFKSI